VSQTKAQLLDGSVVSVAFSAGSAAAPSVYYSADATTGVYFPGTGQVAISTNSSQRLVVDSSGKVGIGTSSPAELLDVYQGNLQVGSHYVSTLNTNYRIRLKSVGAANNNNYTGEIGLAGGGAQPAESSITFATQTWNGSAYVVTEKARIDSSGRVGIGTTSPGYALDVSSSDTGSGYALRLRHNSTANAAILQFTDSNASTQYGAIANDSSSNLKFITGLTERARIDASGRLLVGTSTALGSANSNTVLQLAASSSAGVSTTAEIYSFNTGGGISNFFLNRSNSNTLGTNTAVTSGQQIGDIAFRGADGTNYIPTAAISAFVDGTPGANDMPGRLVFATTADGAASPTERMRIDSSGRLLVGTSSALLLGNSLSNFAINTETLVGGGVLNHNLGATRHGGSTPEAGPVICLARSRGTTIGAVTLVANGDTLGVLEFSGADGTDFGTSAAVIKCEVDGTPGTNDMPGRLVFSTTADGAASPTERMRITSSGEMLLGPNQISTGRTLSVKNVGLWDSGSNTEIGWFGGASPTAVLKFNAWWDAGVDRLHITDADYSAGVVLAQNSNAWGAYSDGRLKKDICPIKDSITLLKEIKPCRFAWKLGSQPDIGFIAQELKTVLPEAVDGEESDFRQEGDRFYGQMAVKHDKLIPVLTAALQEAIAKIETLEARLTDAGIE
jgi:hypothetical protein